MAGSIHKRGKSYRAFYTVPDADGTFVSKSRSFATRRQAAAFLARQAVEMEDGLRRSLGTLCSGLPDRLDWPSGSAQPAVAGHDQPLPPASRDHVLDDRREETWEVVPDDLTRCYDMLLTGRQPAAKRRDSYAEDGEAMVGRDGADLPRVPRGQRSRSLESRD